ncbi:hypothetical protein GTV15_19150 [Streptomyces sp. SID7803]|nr:hypothetical protein [Streptomyces sp. SID7803]
MNKGPIDPQLAHGLMLWLNSSTLDAIFRTFSGHTQVNAGDVRTLPFPSREELLRLADDAPDWLPEQEKLDALVADLFPHCRSLRRVTNTSQASADDAGALLKAFGFDKVRCNDRSALTAFALLGLEPGQPWSKATNPPWASRRSWAS